MAIQHIANIASYIPPICGPLQIHTYVDTVYCFCLAVKKFHGLTSFLSFPEKLSWLPVTLPILGTLDRKFMEKLCGD